MKLPKWLTSGWAVKNLPTIIAVVGKFTDARPPAPGTWTKQRLIVIAAALFLAGCATLGRPDPSGGPWTKPGAAVCR